MGAYRRKTAREKLTDPRNQPRVEQIREKLARTWGEGTVVIPAPLEVDAIMKSVPEGKLITINQIRAALAKKHGATIGCPICTGIFAGISAKAAEEAVLAGETDVTPYWRTLKEGGVINEKYPGGPEGQRAMLEKEGHTVIAKGKKLVVKDYEKSRAEIH